MKRYSPDELIEVLRQHKLWAQGDESGSRAYLSRADLSRADLSGAYLSGADLSGADLSGANLRGVDLDFSVWPLRCGSTNVVCDDRLFAQLFFHLTRLDSSKCSGGVQESMAALREMAASDLFCEYRNDVGKPVNKQ